MGAFELREPTADLANPDFGGRAKHGHAAIRMFSKGN
mgnify:CR=1 FL=1